MQEEMFVLARFQHPKPQVPNWATSLLTPSFATHSMLGSHVETSDPFVPKQSATHKDAATWVYMPTVCPI